MPAYGEVVEFPAFLSRERIAPARPRESILTRVLRLASGAGSLLLQPIQAMRKDEMIKNPLMNDVPNIGRRAHGGATAGQDAAPRMEVPVLDLSLMDAVNTAVDAFREIEGERLMNNLLSQMLADSNARLERRGIRGNVAGSAEVDSLHAQLKRAKEANEHGSAEYRKLQIAANEAVKALASIQETGEDQFSRDTAHDAVKAWDAATS